MVMPDALGITYVNDLSAKDMEKVRSVAFLELTVTFDDHGIPLRPRRPTKVKSTPGKLSGMGGVGTRGLSWMMVRFIVPENALFGVSLSTLVQNDRQREPSVHVPLIFEEVSLFTRCLLLCELLSLIHFCLGCGLADGELP